jgi:hypothetical protein
MFIVLILMISPRPFIVQIPTGHANMIFGIEEVEVGLVDRKF